MSGVDRSAVGASAEGDGAVRCGEHEAADVVEGPGLSAGLVPAVRRMLPIKTMGIKGRLPNVAYLRLQIKGSAKIS